MPKSKMTRKVQAIPHHPLRYRVESWGSKSLPYEVDLSENGGNGACSCRDFEIRCWKNFKESGGKWVDYGHPEHPNPERTQCAHIKAARMKFTNDTLRAIAEEMNKNNPQKSI